MWNKSQEISNVKQAPQYLTSRLSALCYNGTFVKNQIRKVLAN